MQASTETIPVTAGPEDLKALAAGVTSGRFLFARAFSAIRARWWTWSHRGNIRPSRPWIEEESLSGGALFRFLSDRIVEIIGPYIFESAGETAAERILEENASGGWPGPRRWDS
jgi:hypothetical protein